MPSAFEVRLSRWGWACPKPKNTSRFAHSAPRNKYRASRNDASDPKLSELGKSAILLSQFWLCSYKSCKLASISSCQWTIAIRLFHHTYMLNIGIFWLGSPFRQAGRGRLFLQHKPKTPLSEINYVFVVWTQNRLVQHDFPNNSINDLTLASIIYRFIQRLIDVFQ